MRRILSRKALVLLGVVTLLFGVLGVFAFPRVHARAASSVDLVTQGDVEALFNASVNAGVAIFTHAHQFDGVGFVGFVEDVDRAVIHPFSSHDGAHFCVDDWHLMLVTDSNQVDNVFFFTKEQAIADLQATSITFTLDGVSVPTVRTPITLVAGISPPVFAFLAGSFFSPADIGVGPHTAGITATDPVFGFFQDSSTFTVDPSGTGVCLQP